MKVQQIDDYKNELFHYSHHLQKKQENYKKNLRQQQNVKTGELYSLSNDFEVSRKSYVKTIEQKVNALVSMAVAEELKPIFLTLTLPSKFHPFKTLKNGEILTNTKFEFKNLENAISDGYQELKNIYRIFYKRVKYYSNNIYYIKVFESHKTLIPHVHILFFIEEQHMKVMKQLFFKVCREYRLKRVEFDESLLVTNIDNAIGYIMKYVLKTLNSPDQYFNRWLDGWRRKHAIRAVEMSNLPISIEVYKKIYYNLPLNEKENIQKIVEANSQSFFEYFITNSEVHQIIYKEDVM